MSMPSVEMFREILSALGPLHEKGVREFQISDDGVKITFFDPMPVIAPGSMFRGVDASTDVEELERAMSGPPEDDPMLFGGRRPPSYKQRPPEESISRRAGIRDDWPPNQE